MSKIFTIATFLFFSSILTLNAQTKEWTLLVYMVGSDIVDDGITDVGEMLAAGNTDNINIVGLFGGSKKSGWETPTSSLFVNGQEFGQSFVPSTPNMANPLAITEFLNWGISNYPAQKYMLVFYNHGMDIRGFGYDEVAEKSNSIPEIEQGIKNSDFILDNNKFELLGFDACLMASFEVQSSLRDVANYYIASEETEPWHAWNWTPVITALNTQSGLSGAEVGNIIIDHYIQHSIDLGSQNVTLSVSDLSKVDALELSLEQLFESLDDDLYLENFIRARSKTEEYHKVIQNPEYSEDMVDIGDLVKHLLEIEPGLENEVDQVLAALDDMVYYERSDNTRPNAHGVSLYVPYHVLAEEGETDWIIENNYKPINFSSIIKSFISENYLDYALADNSPAGGSIDPNFGLMGTTPVEDISAGTYSAIRVDDHKHLDQIQVVLMEEITGLPDEFLLLGSSYPDTFVHNQDGTTTYAYEWDDQWISLNEHPAYISDIQHFRVKGENGNPDYNFSRIHIPAVVNQGQPEEKDIMLSFVFDDDFNPELESILREPYGDIEMLPSKERIKLQPGDEVQLLYEVFDANTNESYFTANPDAAFTIQNGNEDLNLGHHRLEPGRYHLGFVLTDHSQNDTTIYDPRVHIVQNTRTNNSTAISNQIGISPNPVKSYFEVDLNGFFAERIELYNSVGVMVHSEKLNNQQQVKVNAARLQPGIYLVKITNEQEEIIKKIVKQ